MVYHGVCHPEMPNKIPKRRPPVWSMDRADTCLQPAKQIVRGNASVQTWLVAEPPDITASRPRGLTLTHGTEGVVANSLLVVAFYFGELVSCAYHFPVDEWMMIPSLICVSLLVSSPYFHGNSAGS